MKRFRKYFPLLIIILLSVLAWILNLHHYINIETFNKHQNLLESFIKQEKLISIAIYCAIYIAMISLSIPGSNFLTVIGGFLLERWIGTIATVVSASFGASIIFLSAKMASKDIIYKQQNKWIKKMESGFKEDAFCYLLTLRLIPFFPFSVINIIAAFFQIPLKIFFLATLIGITPISFILASIGETLKKAMQKPDFTFNILLDQRILIAFTILGILSFIPTLYKKYRLKKNNKIKNLS